MVNKHTCLACYLYQEKPNKCILGHKIPREDCESYCKDAEEFKIVRQHSWAIKTLEEIEDE